VLNDVPKVQSLLEAEPARDPREGPGRLGAAPTTRPRTGTPDMVAAADRLKADVSVRTSLGESPLHWATAHGHAEVIRVLLANVAGHRRARPVRVDAAALGGADGQRDAAGRGGCCRRGPTFGARAA